MEKQRIFLARKGSLTQKNRYKWIDKTGDDLRLRLVNDNTEMFDFYVLTGGDENLVSPELYLDTKDVEFEKLYNKTVDQEELNVIGDAISRGKKIVSFGRGASITCVAAGGMLINSILGHSSMKEGERLDHKMYSIDGRHININSNHKTLMYPFNLSRENYALVGWACNLSHEYAAENPDSKHVAGNNYHYLELPSEADYFGVAIDKNETPYTSDIIEPEVIFFRNINAIAFQYDIADHMGDNEFDKKVRDYTFRILNLFLRDLL